MADLVHARSKCQLVFFMAVLCAVGGNNGEAVTNEVYDEVNNKWQV